MSPTALPTAGYFRVSVARDDMKAPELYRDEIERYCTYKRLSLGEIFSDIDHSGFRGAKPRPALEELKRRSLEFSAVVVPKLARFGRSVRDLVELFEFFDRNQVALVFLDMNIDTSTSQGRLLRHIMVAFAEYESDVKADYARAKHRLARSKGLPWGLPPFGYVPDRTNRTYVISKPEAAMVRKIFQRYSEGGVSQYRIATELNDAGRLRGDGKQWTARQVGRILDNPAYVGRCVFDGQLVPGSWEAIVDAKTWERVRAVREADKRRISLLRAAKGGPYLLSGLLHCGHCGRRLVHRATGSGERDGIYVCLEPGGKWCPGGSIGCGRADELVTRRFLDRCRFMIQGREAASFRDSERAWLKSSIEQRRALLSLAIDRVVLVPWPGGDKPRRASPPRREVRIEWAPGTKGREVSVLVAAATPAPIPRHRVSEGRAEMMRDLEADKRRAAREQRSQRARAYYQEWNKRLRALRE
jgi:DNA invertase Pin-like site-specific DNA recombinase